jgi:hypothetical protein
LTLIDKHPDTHFDITDNPSREIILTFFVSQNGVICSIISERSHNQFTCMHVIMREERFVENIGVTWGMTLSQERSASLLVQHGL